MKANWGMLAHLAGLAVLAIAGLALPLALAQAPQTFNEHEVRSQTSALDKPDVWTFDFRFKEPRLIQVSIPGRGPRILWYLWYQVINRTGEPRTFIPDFELVTLDHPGVFHDGEFPAAEELIRKREDSSGYQDIKNSVTIATQPIPPSKADSEAFPRAVTGVAIWDGASADPKRRDTLEKDLADANRFTIFVSGLSNGWVQVDPLVQGKTDAPIVRRKTLQLNFKRLGDRYYMDSREITFVAPAEWIYRASQIRIPQRQPAAAPKAAAAFDLQLAPH
jgi:hypothetical protein